MSEVYVIWDEGFTVDDDGLIHEWCESMPVDAFKALLVLLPPEPTR